MNGMKSDGAPRDVLGDGAHSCPSGSASRCQNAMASSCSIVMPIMPAIGAAMPRSICSPAICAACRPPAVGAMPPLRRAHHRGKVRTPLDRALAS